MSTEKTKGMVVGDRLSEDGRQSVQSSLELYKKAVVLSVLLYGDKKKTLHVRHLNSFHITVL